MFWYVQVHELKMYACEVSHLGHSIYFKRKSGCMKVIIRERVYEHLFKFVFTFPNLGEEHLTPDFNVDFT